MAVRYKNADAILAQPSMQCWLSVELERRMKQDSRTDEQRIWDKAIWAATEYARRLTGDEDLAITMLDLLTGRTEATKHGA